MVVVGVLVVLRLEQGPLHRLALVLRAVVVRAVCAVVQVQIGKPGKKLGKENYLKIGVDIFGR